MANHFHLLAVVDNPEHVDDFVRHLKTESSHVVNRLLGRRKRTVWCEGYDSPTILTVDDVLRYIVYIYTNPQQAKLVRRIDDYPTLSSWSMYSTGSYRKACTWVQRPCLSKVELSSITPKEEAALLEALTKQCQRKHDFLLEPDAWMDCFGVKEKADFYRREIIARIRESEHKLSLHVKTVVGPAALRRQRMDREYVPEKHSKRMICLSSDRNLRRSFIEFFRELCEQAKDAFQNWQRGVFRPWPPGMLAPGGCCHTSVSPWLFS